jgi:hypothetical protein
MFWANRMVVVVYDKDQRLVFQVKDRLEIAQFHLMGMGIEHVSSPLTPEQYPVFGLSKTKTWRVTDTKIERDKHERCERFLLTREGNKNQ